MSGTEGEGGKGGTFLQPREGSGIDERMVGIQDHWLISDVLHSVVLRKHIRTVTRELHLSIKGIKDWHAHHCFFDKSGIDAACILHCLCICEQVRCHHLQYLLDERDEVIR